MEVTVQTSRVSSAFRVCGSGRRRTRVDITRGSGGACSSSSIVLNASPLLQEGESAIRESSQEEWSREYEQGVKQVLSPGLTRRLEPWRPQWTGGSGGTCLGTFGAVSFSDLGCVCVTASGQGRNLLLQLPSPSSRGCRFEGSAWRMGHGI